MMVSYYDDRQATDDCGPSVTDIAVDSGDAGYQSRREDSDSAKEIPPDMSPRTDHVKVFVDLLYLSLCRAMRR